MIDHTIFMVASILLTRIFQAVVEALNLTILP